MIDEIRKEIEKIKERYIDEVITTEILNEARNHFCFYDPIDVKFVSRYKFLHKPEVKAAYNLLDLNKRRARIEIKRFRPSKDFYWELLLYGWGFLEEAIHYIEFKVSSNENLVKVLENRKDTSGHRIVSSMAYNLMLNYMKKKYPSWYEDNQEMLEEIYDELKKSLPD